MKNKSYTRKYIEKLINMALKKDVEFFQPFKGINKSYFKNFDLKIERPKIITGAFKKLFYMDDK